MMKCVIPGVHVRAFGKALYTLSRIGDELWFDPLEKGLAMRVVNSSRSAYACIFFSTFFFHSYQRATINEQGQGNVPVQLNCKFLAKSVLPVFRCLSTLDRNVEACHIYTNFTTCHVVFQLFCRHGLVKTHNLAYEDCEAVEAEFSRETCPNVLKFQSRLLCNMIIHFPTTQEEVTLTCTSLKIILKSYSEEGFSKAMRTEVQLNPDEFHHFQIERDSEVTFCLREVRAFVSFAETSSSVISVHFDQPGQPIMFSIDDVVFDGVLVLATLSDVDDDMSLQKSKESTIKLPPLLKKCRRGPIFDKNDEDLSVNHNGIQQPLTICNPTAKDQHELQEMSRHNSSYNKFHRIFFGAISSDGKEKCNPLVYSLATASEDDDEDNGSRQQLSQTF